jgi:DNA repair protein RadA
LIAQLVGLDPILKADQLLEQKKLWNRFSTGSRNLDNLLLGGIETHALTEFYGDYGTGKTQLALTLSITSQAVDSNCRILFIDTENTFRGARLYQIAENRGVLDPEHFLENILVLKAFDLVKFDSILNRLEAIVRRYTINLIILDSLIALYRAEYSTQGTIIERQQRINKTIHLFKNITDGFGCAVVLTNQVQTKYDDVSTHNYFKPTGGNIVGHGTTYRIHLRKRGKLRFARMIDSPYHPDGEAEFFINEMGLADAPESWS